MLRDRLHQILYVDDDADLREIVEATLQLEPQFSIQTADCGEQALRMMRAEAPDLVLLDVTMPCMDGPTVLRRMRNDESLQGIPVVFMTGHVAPWEINNLVLLGGAGVIAKPFEPMRLKEDIFSAWERLPADPSG